VSSKQKSAEQSTSFLATQETDATNQGSAFRNAWKKISVLAPFLWPKKDVLLQFRVAFCFLLLVAGRGINLYVPIYSKLIGKFKSLDTV
jgi:ATP-binding cassette subfamily B (MDR/TAP) protein 6